MIGAGAVWRINESRQGPLSPLATATIANLVAAAIPLTLLSASAGQSIQPMMHAAMIFAWIPISLGAVVPFALIEIFRHKRRLSGIIALILGFTPLLVSILTFKLVVALKAFKLEG
jgi:hypothetical protein